MASSSSDTAPDRQARLHHTFTDHQRANLRHLRQQGMLYRQRGATFTVRIPDERANERCSMLLGSCLGISAKRWRLGRGIKPLPSTAFPGRSSGTTNVAAAAVLVLAAVDTPSDAIGHSTDAMWRRTWRQTHSCVTTSVLSCSRTTSTFTPGSHTSCPSSGRGGRQWVRSGEGE